ncbi:MAG: class 1 isoprenoid biosynthesis enzyme [Paludibacter sp.]
MNYLSNFIKLIGLLIGFSKKIKSQKAFLQQSIGDIIEESKKNNDGSLDDDDFRKINLYGYAIPAMPGETFCTLTGKKEMSDKERLAMTCLGAITGLFDDFFDKKNLPESRIRELIDNNQKTKPENSNEQLFMQLNGLAYENCTNKDEYTRYFNNVFDGQVLSKKQQSANIEKPEIKEIIFYKGGVSMMLYSCALSQNLSEADKKIIFKLGSIGQLENDIFDVFKDFKEGIKTLATEETKINNLRETYSALIAEIFQLVRETSHSQKNQQKFLRILALVLCRGYVCLEYLERNEKKTGNTFIISAYSKKDLTCDMEKPSSVFRLLHYAAKMQY